MTASLRDGPQASLGSPYTLDRELGGGGMSRVFVARDTRLSRDIVVKVLTPERAAGISAERFTREIQVAAGLQEPHIVPQLTDGVTGDGLPYYTMRFVQGASLRERLHSGRMPAGEALNILRDLANALAYAHSRGVMHRDIKPENILLSNGTAMVTDFGIAKALQASRTVSAERDVHDGLTQTGTSLGTPAYMAPEHAAGDEVDARADIYAWGVIAYEMLSGAHPFSSKTTVQQVIAAHMTWYRGKTGGSRGEVFHALSQLAITPLVVVASTHRQVVSQGIARDSHPSICSSSSASTSSSNFQSNSLTAGASPCSGCANCVARDSRSRSRASVRNCSANSYAANCSSLGGGAEYGFLS